MRSSWAVCEASSAVLESHWAVLTALEAFHGLLESLADRQGSDIAVQSVLVVSRAVPRQLRAIVRPFCAGGCVVQRWRVAFCFGSGLARGRHCASDAASPLLA